MFPPLTVPPHFYRLPLPSPISHLAYLPVSVYRYAVSVSVSVLCLASSGTYCVGGTRTECAAGRYGSTTGLQTSDCSGLCKAGHYGPISGLKTATCADASCFPGYYCPAGSTSATQNACGASRYFCPSGSGVRTTVTEGSYTTQLNCDTKCSGQQASSSVNDFALFGVRFNCPVRSQPSGGAATGTAALGFMVREKMPVDTAVDGFELGQTPWSDDLLAPNIRFSDIRFALLSPAADFAINAIDGRLRTARVGGFDFNVEQSVSVVIQISGKDTVGNETWVDTCEFDVAVADENQAPVLLPTTFTPFENQAEGSIVGTLKPTDPDKSTNFNFEILSQTPDLGIVGLRQVTSGDLIVVDPSRFDFEFLSDFDFAITLNVSVSDVHDRQPQVITQIVTIKVQDVDDLQLSFASITAAGSGTPSPPGEASTAALAALRTEGQETVRLEGTGFANLDGADFGWVVSAVYGDMYTAKDCVVVEPNIAIQCLTIPGVGFDHEWKVTLTAKVAGAANAETIVGGVTSYGPPSISALDGATNMLSDGSSPVKIFGINFGPVGTPVEVTYEYGSEFSAKLSSSGCEKVCHKDACKGTATNPIPNGEQWVVNEKASSSGCCGSKADKCDLCCPGAGACQVKASPTLGEGNFLHCARTKEGFGGPLSWQVLVGGQRSEWTNTTAIKSEYAPPVVKSVAPTTGPTNANPLTTIVVGGTNFALSSTVAVGARPCVVTDSSYKEIHAEVPPWVGKNLKVSVKIGSVRDQGNLRFSYDAPIISTVLSSVPRNANGQRPDDLRASTQGGAILTVAGSNFGPAACADARSLSEGSSPRGSDGTRECAVRIGDAPLGGTHDPADADGGGPGVWCDIITWDHELIKCTVGQGVGANLAVRVAAGNAFSRAATTRFSFDAPVVTSVTPNLVRGAGGDRVAVGGRNFGPLSTSKALKVFIGEPGTPKPAGVEGDTWPVEAVGCIRVDHGTIICSAPAGQGANHPVRVSVGNQTSATGAKTPDGSSSKSSSSKVNSDPLLDGGDGLPLISYEPPQICKVYCILSDYLNYPAHTAHRPRRTHTSSLMPPACQSHDALLSGMCLMRLKIRSLTHSLTHSLACFIHPLARHRTHRRVGRAESRTVDDPRDAHHRRRQLRNQGVSGFNLGWRAAMYGCEVVLAVRGSEELLDMRPPRGATQRDPQYHAVGGALRRASFLWVL